VDSALHQLRSRLVERRRLSHEGIHGGPDPVGAIAELDTLRYVVFPFHYQPGVEPTINEVQILHDVIREEGLLGPLSDDLVRELIARVDLASRNVATADRLVDPKLALTLPKTTIVAVSAVLADGSQVVYVVQHDGRPVPVRTEAPSIASSDTLIFDMGNEWSWQDMARIAAIIIALIAIAIIAVKSYRRQYAKTTS
jgi:hypothetical protein